jgi:cell division protein FtsQ
MRERRVGAVAVLALVVVGVGGWLVVNSPLFSVRHIRVLGNITLTADEVISLAGVSEGENLFRLAPGDLEEALRRNPWVAEVAVEREWPSTLVLRVTERAPVGWARVSGDRRVLVAADGTVLAAVKRKPDQLPSLGSLELSPAPGSLYEGPRPVLEVAASFAPELRRQVAGVLVGESGVDLRLRVGGTVLYGPASSTDAKNAALVSILRQVRREALRIEYVDVRIPSAPALKAEPAPTPVPTPTG